MLRLTFYERINVAELGKSQKKQLIVIPAKAGIQVFQKLLDPGSCPPPADSPG